MTHVAQSQADGHADGLAADVIEELAAVLDLQVDEVKPTDDLRADFGVKPRDFDMLRWALASRWHFDTPGHAIAGWKTVGDVVSYVAMRTGAGV